jgi:hypothetical protein
MGESQRQTRLEGIHKMIEYKMTSVEFAVYELHMVTTLDNGKKISTTILATNSYEKARAAQLALTEASIDWRLYLAD